jgi:hypothetical protein
MKIFISWSGELSNKVALILAAWLETVIQNLKPYVTSDMDKGTRWFDEISNELEASDFGIICLTPSNLDAPWLLFESGALAKKVGKAHVIPFLINLTPADVKQPLGHFQATTFNNTDVKRMIRTLNDNLEGSKLKSETLDKLFATLWPELEANIIKAINESTEVKSKEKIRSEREILEEVLELTRAMTRWMPRSGILNRLEDDIALRDVLKFLGERPSAQRITIHDMLEAVIAQGEKEDNPKE